MSTTAAQLERMIHRAGYREARRNGGSHRHFRHEQTGAALTVAFRKGQRIRPGTLKAIEEQVRTGQVRKSKADQIAAGVAVQQAMRTPHQQTTRQVARPQKRQRVTSAA